MKRFIKPFPNVKTSVDFFLKFRFFYMFLFLLFQNFSFAQDYEAQDISNLQIQIVVNGATIHSTDDAFNKQLLSSAKLENVEIDATKAGEINIVAKDDIVELEREASDKDLLTKKEVLASKHHAIKNKIQKKDIHIHINDCYYGNKFLFKNSSLSKSFVYPTNDFRSSHHTVLSEINIVTRSLDFLFAQLFFTINNDSIFRGSSSNFSVRPPPFLT